MTFRLVHKVPEREFFASVFRLLRDGTEQFSGVWTVILEEHLIRRLLVALLTALYAEKVFIFAVLRPFVFEYHVPIGVRRGGATVLSGGRKSITGPGRRLQVPHPVAGQGVQLVAAHGDGLVQGLHGGPAGGARVEAAG